MAHIMHLELEIELHRQPIAGVLRSQDPTNRSFDGWLELASAIEDARNTASAAVAADGSASGTESTARDRGRTLTT